MRYASMMPLGAVILKVDSATKADSMWYFPLLRAFDPHAPRRAGDVAAGLGGGDHIRVKADLSDLREVIAWCRAHDAECERIAANSRALYERLIAREGQLDYLQLLACGVRSLPRVAKDAAHPSDRLSWAEDSWDGGMAGWRGSEGTVGRRGWVCVVTAMAW